MKKGQYLRLFVKNAQSTSPVPIAAATNMTLHVSATTENSSTKDTTGDWEEFEVTGLSFDIQSDALVINDENPSNESNIEMLENMLTDESYNFNIAATTGQHNREWEEDTPICTGKVKLTSLQVTAANRQNSTVSASFSGDGELTIVGILLDVSPSLGTNGPSTVDIDNDE